MCAVVTCTELFRPVSLVCHTRWLSVTDLVAAKILEHPSVIGCKDGLFPQLDQTWRMLSFVEAVP